jgi:hypothetical protein
MVAPLFTRKEQKKKGRFAYLRQPSIKVTTAVPKVKQPRTVQRLQPVALWLRRLQRLYG